MNEGSRLSDAAESSMGRHAFGPGKRNDEETEWEKESHVEQPHEARNVRALCTSLAKAHTQAPARSLGREELIGLTSCKQQLQTAVAKSRKALLNGASPSTAVHWLLDNRDLIDAQLGKLRRSLSIRRTERLPAVLGDNQAPVLRIGDLATHLVSLVDGRLDRENILLALTSYQESSPLILSELWALPDMLALALIDTLAHAATCASEDISDCAKAVTIARRYAQGEAHRPERPSRALLAELSRLMHCEESLAEEHRAIFGSASELRDIIMSVAERQVKHESVISQCISSLRFLEHARWRDIVDLSSTTERTLSKDPSGLYSEMDFVTRNKYRQAAALLSRELAVSEADVAAAALRLAEESVELSGTRGRRSHVGYYLIDDGVDAIRSALGKGRLRSSIFLRRHKGFLPGVYVTAQLLTAIVCCFPLVALLVTQVSAPAVLVISMLLLPVVGHVSVKMVDAIAGRWRLPTSMPRMNYREGVPEHARTLVVVPCLLQSPENVRSLLEGMRMRFLANRTPNVRFAILSDFTDADARTTRIDVELLEIATAGIRQLNVDYAEPHTDLFYMLHRDRTWNAAQNCWMGYERKRGKLAALNSLLLRGCSDAFSTIVGNMSQIGEVKYVITLDSDTQLPWGAARRLIETMDHPLNRPTLSDDGTKVVSGYAIIQPRLSTLFSRKGSTRYARLFGGESGLDQYTSAAADLYHDLFGEGSYTGKGIYDVAAFDQLLCSRFPDNRILSHDLIEGCFARATVATDIEVFEEYPLTYSVDNHRRQRWIRGDWQIAAWLGLTVPVAGGETKNTLSVLSRWKLLENLRRSVFEPATLILLVSSWLVAELSAVWVVISMLPLMLPAMMQIARVVFERGVDARSAVVHQPIGEAIGNHIGRAIFALACLPFASWQTMRSIIVTGWRVIVTRRNLLEWEAFDVLQRRVESRGNGGAATLNFPLLKVNLVFLAAVSLATVYLRPENLIIALPWLCLWGGAPLADLWLSQSCNVHAARLNESDVSFVRQAARRTWAYFEDYVNQDSQWLPPDNVRELPPYAIASRTSPTNIGLGLLSTITAYDLGYLDKPEVVGRLAKMLATLDRMKRYRGHLYNWYDTQTLEPMPPQYISAVDSGNFVAHVLVLRQALIQMISTEQPSEALLRGVGDTFAVFCDSHNNPDSALTERFETCLRGIVQNGGFASHDAHLESAALVGLAEQLASSSTPRNTESSGWANKLRVHCAMVRSHIEHLQSAAQRDGDGFEKRLHELISICDRLATCDFRLFYDEERELLRIGFNTRTGKCDAEHYDMLASEARLTTFIAVARNEIPPEAWFSLRRLQTYENGKLALLSWSGSMFEYLMPSLVMPNFSGSLLENATHGAVHRQIEYTKSGNTPWGVSESGYADFDTDQNYCYHAFGIPSLGLQASVLKNLVIAPYASALAMIVDAPRAVANLMKLAESGMLTSWGFYEAVEYSKIAPKHAIIVREFMAHHQGMSLLAFASVITGDCMQRLFCADPELRAASILLNERMPKRSQVIARDKEISVLEASEHVTVDEDAETKILAKNNPTAALEALAGTCEAVVMRHCRVSSHQAVALRDVAMIRSLHKDGFMAPEKSRLKERLCGREFGAALHPVLVAHVPREEADRFCSEVLALHSYSYCQKQSFSLVLLVDALEERQSNSAVAATEAIASSPLSALLRDEPGGIFLLENSRIRSSEWIELDEIAAAELQYSSGELHVVSSRHHCQRDTTALDNIN